MQVCKFCRQLVFRAVIVTGFEDPGVPLPRGTNPGVFAVTRKNVIVTHKGNVNCSHRPRAVNKKRKKK